jgi:hypothetical protein
MTVFQKIKRFFTCIGGNITIKRHYGNISPLEPDPKTYSLIFPSISLDLIIVCVLPVVDHQGHAEACHHLDYVNSACFLPTAALGSL